jgi:hypothetical protein
MQALLYLGTRDNEVCCCYAPRRKVKVWQVQ